MVTSEKSKRRSDNSAFVFEGFDDFFGKFFLHHVSGETDSWLETICIWFDWMQMVRFESIAFKIESAVSTVSATPYNCKFRFYQRCIVELAWDPGALHISYEFEFKRDETDLEDVEINSRGPEKKKRVRQNNKRWKKFFFVFLKKEMSWEGNKLSLLSFF